MNERGFALVTVVLLMIGLAVLATAFGFAAAQQAAVRASLQDLSRARYAADAAAAAVIDGWVAARRSIEPVGSTVPLLSADFEPGVRVAASSVRMAGETWLVEARASVARGALQPIVQHARRVVRGLNADSVGAAFDAALIASSVRVDAGAGVQGTSVSTPYDVETASLCARWASDGAALRTPLDSTSISREATVTGTPVLQPDPRPERFRAGLGSIAIDQLKTASFPVAAGRITPEPHVMGTACDTAAAPNWGGPDGPCAHRFVLAHVAGPATLDGGYGQGILVVSGDVVLEGGFRFRGLIIGDGTVALRDAFVEGSIAAERVRLEQGARAVLDRGALAGALAHVPAVRRARIPPRSWLPTFD